MGHREIENMHFVYHNNIPWVKIPNGEGIEKRSFIMQGMRFVPGKKFREIGEGRTGFALEVPLIYEGIKENHAIFSVWSSQLSLFANSASDWYIGLGIVWDKSVTRRAVRKCCAEALCLLCAIGPGMGYDIRWKSER